VSSQHDAANPKSLSASFRFRYGYNSNPASAFRLPYPGLGVNKTFQLTERQSLRFSAYAYNLTNSVRFDAATLTNNSALTDPATIGLYTGTLSKPRVMEFARRYGF